jgi:hypothetical protein
LNFPPRPEIWGFNLQFLDLFCLVTWHQMTSKITGYPPISQVWDGISRNATDTSNRSPLAVSSSIFSQIGSAVLPLGERGTRFCSSSPCISPPSVVMTLCGWPFLDQPYGRSRDGRPQGIEWADIAWPYHPYTNSIPILDISAACVSPGSHFMCWSELARFS